MEEEFAKIARANSEGDRDIESTIFSSLCSVFDDNADKKDLFYQSIFVMCYSYYESCVTLLGKNENTKETNTKKAIIDICESQKISLSEDALKAINYLQDNIRVLRNNICHNNFGTYRKSSVLVEITKRNTGFGYDGKTETLFFTDSKIIIDTLNKMHMVLHELCEKLGYKTQYAGKAN